MRFNLQVCPVVLLQNLYQKSVRNKLVHFNFEACSIMLLNIYQKSVWKKLMHFNLQNSKFSKVNKHHIFLLDSHFPYCANIMQDTRCKCYFSGVSSFYPALTSVCYRRLYSESFSEVRTSSYSLSL